MLEILSMVNAFFHSIIYFVSIEAIAKCKNKKIIKIIFYIVGMIIQYEWGKTAELNSIVKIVLELILVTIYIKLISEEYRFLKVASVVLVSKMLETISGIGIPILVMIIIPKKFFEQKGYFSIIVCILLRIVVILFIKYGLSKTNIKEILNNKKSQIITIIFGSCIVILQQVVVMLRSRAYDIYNYFLVSIICLLIIFASIWLIDRYFSYREKSKILEDNKRLAAQLHKSREILPAMASALKHNSEDEENSEEQQELIREIEQLCKEQRIENGKDDMKIKSFPKTGIRLLDLQIEGYGLEAVRREINFDVYVPEPILQHIVAKKISQMKLQRAIGDLVRNAYQAIMRDEDIKGRVLLVIGFNDEDELEIDIYDNGVRFPREVEENFGMRGITTDGTGNGLADIMDFVNEMKASLMVEEYFLDTYKKGIKVIFDKKNQYSFVREEY